MALATQGLAKRYGSRVALDGLDLRVPTGVVYGFLGPNGAGKTTTMRILTGLIRPDAGGVEVLGRPVAPGRSPAPVRGRGADRVAVLLPVPVRAREPAGARRDRRADPQGRVDELLALVNLQDRGSDKVSGYSLGMKQRLGIASALLSDPKLLLLDEPANGLDPAGIVGMRDTLRALAAAGKTVFVSSHILSEVQQLADVVGIIARGKLVREGPIEDLLRAEGAVRIRVATDQVATAGPILEQAAGPGRSPPNTGRRRAGCGVRIDPERAAELNRALSEAGVYASRIEGGDDARIAVPRAHRDLARPGRRDTRRGRPRVGGMRLLRSNLGKLRRRPATLGHAPAAARAPGADHPAGHRRLQAVQRPRGGARQHRCS